MPSDDALIDTGRLPSGHPYARIGTGERVVLSIPGLSFTDIREIQRELKAQGVEFVAEVDEAGSGPGSFIVVDPDGNPIFVDQHV